MEEAEERGEDKIRKMRVDKEWAYARALLKKNMKLTFRSIGYTCKLLHYVLK